MTTLRYVVTVHADFHNAPRKHIRVIETESSDALDAARIALDEMSTDKRMPIRRSSTAVEIEVERVA